MEKKPLDLHVCMCVCVNAIRPGLRETTQAKTVCLQLHRLRVQIAKIVMSLPDEWLLLASALCAYIPNCIGC